MYMYTRVTLHVHLCAGIYGRSCSCCGLDLEVGGSLTSLTAYVQLWHYWCLVSCSLCWQHLCLVSGGTIGVWSLVSGLVTFEPGVAQRHGTFGLSRTVRCHITPH